MQSPVPAASATRFVETEKLLTCVHCGLCQSACPTYLELGTEADSPRGRIHLMRALEEGRLEPSPEVVRHLDLCLGCRACETACPSGVRVRRAHRGGAAVAGAAPSGTGASRPTHAGRRADDALAAAGRSSRPRGSWPVSRGRAAGSAMPPRCRGGGAARCRRCSNPTGQPRGTAVLVTGCVAESLFGDTNHATAALLRRAGVRVVVPPGQGCCGALPLHLGARARAETLARRLARTLARTGADWVVSNAAGCGALLREYDHLLPGDADAAAGRATRARRARAARGARTAAARPQASLPRTVAVHDPCHLAHGQGVRAQVRTLLAAVPGVRVGGPPRVGDLLRQRRHLQPDRARDGAPPARAQARQRRRQRRARWSRRPTPAACCRCGPARWRAACASRSSTRSICWRGRTACDGPQRPHMRVSPSRLRAIRPRRLSRPAALPQ